MNQNKKIIASQMAFQKFSSQEVDFQIDYWAGCLREFDSELLESAFIDFNKTKDEFEKFEISAINRRCKEIKREKEIEKKEIEKKVKYELFKMFCEKNVDWNKNEDIETRIGALNDYFNGKNIKNINEIKGLFKKMKEDRVFFENFKENSTLVDIEFLGILKNEKNF